MYERGSGRTVTVGHFEVELASPEWASFVVSTFGGYRRAISVTALGATS